MDIVLLEDPAIPLLGICSQDVPTGKKDTCSMLQESMLKDTINKTKRPPTDWERIFTNPKLDRGLISNIYIRNSRRLTPENQITPLKMGLRAKQRILT